MYNSDEQSHCVEQVLADHPEDLLPEEKLLQVNE